MMKIAICGTHRVGKTSLAEALQEQLPGYELLMEPYYDLEASGYVFADVPDAEDYLRQFHHSLKQITKGGEEVIFDRCPIDILAYIHATDRKKNILAQFQSAQMAMETIDLLVFVPVESPDIIPQDDAQLPKLRIAVNEILAGWMEDFNIKYIVVSGDLKSRVQQVLAAIQT